MELFFSLTLFIIGFYILIKGASILVNGATSIAKLYNISSWFIGVVIVGIGTSIPEFSVSVASVFNGNNIGMGTIIGTNIFNILVILGFSALFYPIIMKKEWVTIDFLLNLGAVVIAALVIIFPLLGDNNFSGVTKEEGIVLTALLFLWVFFMFQRRMSEEDTADYKIFTLLTSVVLVIAGFLGVFFGGSFVVRGAETIATLFGASPTLIAITIVAIGTSLPELAVSMVALFKRTVGIAVGNVIGSNIINFLGIIGATAFLRAIPIEETFRFDILPAVLAVLLLFAVMFIGKPLTLSRSKGVLFIVIYIIYIIFIIMRG